MKNYLLLFILLKNLNLFQSLPLLPIADNFSNNWAGNRGVIQYTHHHNQYHHHGYQSNHNDNSYVHNYGYHNHQNHFQHNPEYHKKENEIKRNDDHLKDDNDNVNDFNIEVRTIMDPPKNCPVDFKGRCIKFKSN